jgi:hypothetical protein
VVRKKPNYEEQENRVEIKKFVPAQRVGFKFYPWQVPTKRRFERAVLLFKLDEICAKIKGNLVVL